MLTGVQLVADRVMVAVKALLVVLAELAVAVIVALPVPEVALRFNQLGQLLIVHETLDAMLNVFELLAS